ncbi:MAG: flagellar M-ring protein FliF [Sphingomonadales bacterium]|nr:flagellar M-ring protein FliF [Sphingomonadales bacterium]
MADLVPAGNAPPDMGGLPAMQQPSLLTPLTDPAGGPLPARLKGFFGQPAVKKTLPWFVGVAALGAAALSWNSMAPAPQRVLYAQLDDSERATIVAALDKAQIHYKIDNQTGTLTVDEDQLYKARMTVAQNGALATPDTASDGLDKLPLGASRTLEGERLRAAREHELMLTIKEIDGVQSVRVHLAEGEKSVFVRDNTAPSASVMLRLADGRQLSQGQVTAIVNLVAGSVPGLTPDAVRVIDQHGRLLTDKTVGNADSDRFELQSRMEAKLQNQVATLLTPMVGEGNFTSEVQVDLDMDQVTSARESYDKQGVLRSETQAQSQTTAPGQAAGVPGTLSNTPPPAAQASPGAPQGTASPAPGASPSPSPSNGESSATRNYELGREVAVSNQAPGKIKRLGVAVALSSAALKNMKPSDIDQIKQLVSAAVGADTTRGDQIAVIVRAFDATPDKPVPFYEQPWFAMAVRYGVALLAVILTLLIAVRPLVRAVTGEKKAKGKKAKDDDGADDDIETIEGERIDGPMIAGNRTALPTMPKIDAELLGRHVGLVQQIVLDKPDSALLALRQMLQPASEEPAT